MGNVFARADTGLNGNKYTLLNIMHAPITPKHPDYAMMLIDSSVLPRTLPKLSYSQATQPKIPQISRDVLLSCSDIRHCEKTVMAREALRRPHIRIRGVGAYRGIYRGYLQGILSTSTASLSSRSILSQ